MSSGNIDLRSAGGIFYLNHIDLQSLVREILLSLDHFALIQNTICFAKVDIDALVHDSLNHTRYDFVFLLIIFREKSLSFFFADFLQDHILRVLCCNTSEFLGINANIHHITCFIGTVGCLCLLQADLGNRIFNMLNNGLFGNYFKIACFTIHVHTHIVCLAEMVLTCCQQRILDCFHQCILANVFFTLKYVKRF